MCPPFWVIMHVDHSSVVFGAPSFGLGMQGDVVLSQGPLSHTSKLENVFCAIIGVHQVKVALGEIEVEWEGRGGEKGGGEKGATEVREGGNEVREGRKEGLRGESGERREKGGGGGEKGGVGV